MLERSTQELNDAPTPPKARLAAKGFKSRFSRYEGQVVCPHGGCRFLPAEAKVHRSADPYQGIECPKCHARGVLGPDAHGE